ncbi:hypothetical protein [Klebsiella quasivariicola]|uniref:hypothetical protein n=1 Tax=Klebsiella quasivariicola TaxID=2026240 RepID=UPI002478F1FA|nr:hypothetical protein [Klebsiella quasivariicola]
MIDEMKIQALAARRLNEQQIADVLDIDMQELRGDSATLLRYREAIRKGRAKGEAELRSVLYKRAKNGDRSAYTELMRREKEGS